MDSYLKEGLPNLILKINIELQSMEIHIGYGGRNPFSQNIDFKILDQVGSYQAGSFCIHI